jgi:GNAT superfamily N-acetyltransferase
VSGYRIEPLQASHAVEAFDCGEEALNRFLVRFALANQRARASRTYVALDGDVVVGFHTLVVGEVSPELAPERIRKGLARHPIPLMVLARLAVAVAHQGKGLGAALLKDAIGRTLAAADIAGIRAWRCMPKMNGPEASTSISASGPRPLTRCTCSCCSRICRASPAVKGLAGEVCMDATAQARATSDRLPGFEGGAEDRAGFLLVCSSRLRIVSVVMHLFRVGHLDGQRPWCR